MPYTAKEEIFCDVDPSQAKATGKALGEPPAAGGFTLVGKGGVIEDDLAERFGLKGDNRLEKFDEAKNRADIEARNVATYEQNADATKAHQGYPAPAATADTLPAPSAAPAPAPEGFAALSAAEPDAPRRGRPRSDA